MELQAVMFRAKPKCLMTAAGGKSQPLGASRQVERLPMPVEDGLGGDAAEECVARRGFGEVQIEPADFLDGVTVHPGAQTPGQELRPETNPQHRLVARHCLGDQVQFLVNVGQAVIRRHWATENNQGRVSGDIGRPDSGHVQIGVVQPDVALSQQGLDPPGAFERNVAESENFHPGLFVRFAAFVLRCDLEMAQALRIFGEAAEQGFGDFLAVIRPLELPLFARIGHKPDLS